jgi:predicted metal-binding membrane protein
MTPLQVSRASPLQAAPGAAPRAARQHPEVVVGVLAAAGLAWWWTVRRMAGMDAGPGTDLGTLGWFAGTWVVMMAAMMLPSLAPNLTAYRTLAHGRAGGRVLLFACGYLLAWATAGVVAYGLFELGKGVLAGDLAWHSGGRWVSAGVLALAAAYEFTPAKQACLTRCRGQLDVPHGPSSHRWSVALAMGARSGGWCIGCSWVLMAALFALGVMSLTWMALIAALVVLEKTSPRLLAAKLATATVLAALTVGILAAPQRVPGLVVPGSGAMHR